MLGTAYALLERFGHRFVALELVRFHPEALAAVRTPQLRRLGRGLDGWAAVDTFSCLVAGHAWRAGQVPDAEIHRWARSRDLWWRRAALVATVPLNLKSHGGAGDARRTLAVCRLLVDDRDDMVVKALSWALRVLSEREPGVVDAFVAQKGDALAARVRREVGNKLRTGLKNPVRTS